MIWLFIITGIVWFIFAVIVSYYRNNKKISEGSSQHAVEVDTLKVPSLEDLDDEEIRQQLEALNAELSRVEKRLDKINNEIDSYGEDDSQETYDKLEPIYRRQEKAEKEYDRIRAKRWPIQEEYIARQRRS